MIHNVVQNQEAVNLLIDNLLTVMTEKGYQGVDIDFEYILAEDRDAFTDFVWQVAERMRANGYHTSVALAPKTSADQKGVLYEGKDYRALGAAADHVLLMTYEWGYTYGPPMAVAPLNQVRRVVEYAVTEIPPQKIDLGIPNYGYDWPLPFVRGRPWPPPSATSRRCALPLNRMRRSSLPMWLRVLFSPIYRLETMLLNQAAEIP